MKSQHKGFFYYIGRTWARLFGHTEAVGFSSLAQEGERAEGSFWDVVDPISVAAKLKIGYRDIHGKRTIRLVSVKQFGTLSGNYLMVGHCHLRNETRTFRADRVQSCVDVETGEVVTNVVHHLRGKFDASPDRAADKLRESELDTLKILFFLGKADGQLRAAETAIIRETGHRILNDSRLTDKMIDAVLKDLGAPSLQAFRLAIGRVSKRPMETRAAIIDASRRMVATQKTVAAAEAEALAYIEKRLS